MEMRDQGLTAELATLRRDMDALQGHLEELSERTTGKDRRWHLEKLAIPFAIALLAAGTGISGAILSYFGSRSSQNITRDIAHAEKEAARNELERAYIDRVYTDVVSADPVKQKVALSLLLGIDSIVGNRLIRAIANNPGISPEVRNDARRLALFGPAANVDIRIYYPASRPDLLTKVELIQETLAGAELPVRITYQGVSASTLEQWQRPARNEIRFDELYEREAAEHLQAFLQRYMNQRFELKPARLNKRTAGVLTVFIVE